MTGDLADERYVPLTTWMGDGRPKHTPIWIVGRALKGSVGSPVRVGFTRGSRSWKVRRIFGNPVVELQPSDTEGALLPGSFPTAGQA